MDHKLQANLHHLLLQMQDSTKYDSICYMLQNLYSRQSNTRYSSSGLPDYVEELAAEWPEYSGYASYPIWPSPYITTFVDVRDIFWIARRSKTLWVGKYGAARQRLLDFLIERTAP